MLVIGNLRLNDLVVVGLGILLLRGLVILYCFGCELVLLGEVVSLKVYRIRSKYLRLVVLFGFLIG